MNKELLLYFALLLWFVVPLGAQPTIFASQIDVDPNGIAEVKVMARDFDAIIGLQFAVEWDESVIEFITAKDFSLPLAGSNNFNISDSGRLRIRWNGDAHNIDDNAVLFTIEFKVIGNPNDFTSVHFRDDPNPNSTPFVIEAIDANSSIINLTFEDGSVSINGPMSNTNALETIAILSQNAPNPFDNQTLITIELNTTQDLEFVVLNTLGQEILKRTAKYTVGKHHIVIQNKDLPTAGIYIYKIRGEQGEISKKMFFIK